MNANNQRFFDIGGAAGAGSKANKRRQAGKAIFLPKRLQGIPDIIYQLVSIRYADMNRRIYAGGAAAWLGRAQHDGPRPRYQRFATGDGRIAAGQVGERRALKKGFRQ